MGDIDLPRIEAERARIRDTYLKPDRDGSTARGLHHVAISVEPRQWERAKQRLDQAGVAYLQESGTSIYLTDPDGARVELIADPLGEMYGNQVL